MGWTWKRAPCLGWWEGRDTWIHPKRRPRSGSEWLTPALCLDPARGMLFWGPPLSLFCLCSMGAEGSWDWDVCPPWTRASPPLLPAWNSLALLLGQCSRAQNTIHTCTRWACRRARGLWLIEGIFGAWGCGLEHLRIWEAYALWDRMTREEAAGRNSGMGCLCISSSQAES